MLNKAEVLLLLDLAEQLADIAIDWNLDEVEIDGEMTDTRDLRDKFHNAKKAMV